MNKKMSSPQERQYTKASQEGKKGFISSLLSYARGHLMTLGLVLLFLLLVVGGYFGLRYYQYRQSSFFTFTNFYAAMQPPNAERLAKLVDFNTLSERLAKVIARDYSFFKAGPNQARDLKDMIQMQLLKRVMTKEEPAKEKPDPQKLKQMPLAVFPDDFLTQFTKNLVIQKPGNGAGNASPVLLSSSVEHPILNRTFPVVLRMDDNGDGWKIREIANAEELVGQFRAAQLERMEARRDEQFKKRTDTLKRMSGIISLQSCSAGLTRLSDGKTLLLVTNILGRNTSALTVNNTNLEAVFNARDGVELLRRNLNTAQPVKPGDNFGAHWNIEVDLQSESGQRILNAGEISCSVEWHSMGLANGEVLYITDVPEMVEDFQ